MSRLAAVALALLLASCGTMGPPEERMAAPKVEPSSADEVVAYLARLRTMGPAAVTTEATRQRQAASARAPGELARVKAAIALLVAQHAEDAEILALVEPVARFEDPDLRAMASFLHILAADRRRLRESAAARVRDERRAQEQLRSRADAAQERAEQLQQKLDALTALEKSLSNRQPSSR